MKEGTGNMNKLLNLVLFLSLSVFADNEIYVDQSGNSASIDLEQLGSSNLITGKYRKNHHQVI